MSVAAIAMTRTLVRSSVLRGLKIGAQATSKYNINRIRGQAASFHYGKGGLEAASRPMSEEVGSTEMSSMTASSLPVGESQNLARYAAFLGEADSNDGHEANRDAIGKPHEAMDGNNAAFLGEADSNDAWEVSEDIEGREQVALDAKNAAFLGESDGDDAFEADFEVNPGRHQHEISEEDAKNAAFLGEADSNDAYEVDRVTDPDKYRHHIEDASSSGLHGEAGHQDREIEY